MSQQGTKDTGSFLISLIDNHLYGLPSEGRGYLPISEIRGGVLKCKGGGATRNETGGAGEGPQHPRWLHLAQALPTSTRCNWFSSGGGQTPVQ